MIHKLSPLLPFFGLLGATTASLPLNGCRGDNADGSRSGMTTKAARSSRAPQRVVGEFFAPEDPSRDTGGDGRTLKRLGVDAGVIQVDPLKDREQLEVDSLLARESAGVQLEVEWKQSDIPAPSGAPETAAEGIEDARAKTRLRMRIELATVGRMRASFLGQGYPWPEGTELRARADKFGQVLVWPDAKSYRNVVPGALRSLFADRRLDIGPLFVPKVTPLPPGQWLGQPTVRSILTTPVAEIQIDQASVPGAGLGAALLCRMLVELSGVEPDNSICNGELLPLHAQLTNAPGGKLGFFVTSLGKKQEFALSAIQVPPEHATFQSSGLPIPTGGAVSRALLSSLRYRAAAPSAPSSSTAVLTPSTGLVAVNRALSLRALIVDGIAVAWLAPGAEIALPELRNGQYAIAWRDFFGTFVEPSRNVVLPARVTLGDPPDAGN
jgi:hypothetical protein